MIYYEYSCEPCHYHAHTDIKFKGKNLKCPYCGNKLSTEEWGHKNSDYPIKTVEKINDNPIANNKRKKEGKRKTA